jgi:hypothetical protein
MLAAISDMKITTKLLENHNDEEDIVDQNYKKLSCDIQAVDKNVYIVLFSQKNLR